MMTAGGYYLPVSHYNGGFGGDTNPLLHYKCICWFYSQGICYDARSYDRKIQCLMFSCIRIQGTSMKEYATHFWLPQTGAKYSQRWRRRQFRPSFAWTAAKRLAWLSTPTRQFCGSVCDNVLLIRRRRGTFIACLRR